MAFRASNVIPSDAYQTVKRAAVALKSNLQEFVTLTQAGATNYDLIRDIYFTLTRAAAQFATLKTTPGLAAYARDQEDDPAYDVAAEFLGMESSIAGAIAWIEANVPTSVTALTPDQWTNDTMISNTFTVGQTGGLRTELNAVIASIS